MNIWLPIITNSVIAIILLIGLLTGIRRGFKLQLAKFLMLIPLLVGSYFLQPVLTALTSKIEFVYNIMQLEYGLQLVQSLILFALFLISYLLVIIFIALVRASYRKHKGLNPIKQAKIKGLDRKATRELRKEQRQLRKLNRPKLKFASKFFGAIFGIMIAFIGAFLFILPFKYVAYGYAELKPEQSEITTGYDYTIYGQLDKITNNKISEFVITK